MNKQDAIDEHERQMEREARNMKKKKAEVSEKKKRNFFAPSDFRKPYKGTK